MAQDFLHEESRVSWPKLEAKNICNLVPNWSIWGGREVMCDISIYILEKRRTDRRDTQGKKNTRISCTNWECWMIFMQYQQIKLPGLAHSYINPGFAGELSVNHQPGTLENEWLVYFVSLRFWCLLEEVYGATFFWLLFNWWLAWWKKIDGGFPIPFRRKAPRIALSLKLT